MANVGIVIVSHSEKVAEGAADMVRQMVGDAVPLAYTGGNSEGGLGTDVARIMDAIGCGCACRSRWRGNQYRNGHRDD
jgi:dihydroxyacetone kinase DhaKLM complex PTS-EIIA-like component DhaM